MKSWSKRKSSPLPPSDALEAQFDAHLAQIPVLASQIIDASQQERNHLRDREDALTVELLQIQAQIEDLRKRSERVYIRANESAQQ